jgi:hypothetical protein
MSFSGKEGAPADSSEATVKEVEGLLSATAKDGPGPEQPGSAPSDAHEARHPNPKVPEKTSGMF